MIIFFVIFSYYALQAVRLFNIIGQNTDASENIINETLTGTTSTPIADLPVKIKIPALSINAAVQHLGLTPDGLMDIPTDHANAAWYQAGSRPGEIGNAVIAGHYGTANSVFNDLGKLKEGDEIITESDKGESISFTITRSEIYGAAADASEVFFSTDGLAHLNLITCTGNWDKITKSYPSRLIIFADMKR